MNDRPKPTLDGQLRKAALLRGLQALVTGLGCAVVGVAMDEERQGELVELEADLRRQGYGFIVDAIADGLRRAELVALAEYERPCDGELN